MKSVISGPTEKHFRFLRKFQQILRLKFRFRRKFRHGNADLIGIACPGQGIAHCDRGRMGGTAETAELEFPPVTGEDTAPGHADVKGDQRHICFRGQQQRHTVFKGGHGTVPCNISFREDAYDFTFTEKLVKVVAIIRLDISEYTAKCRPLPKARPMTADAGEDA